MFVPLPPVILSLPEPAKITSSPPFALIVSAFLLPIMISELSVPLILPEPDIARLTLLSGSSGLIGDFMASDIFTYSSSVESDAKSLSTLFASLF